MPPLSVETAAGFPRTLSDFGKLAISLRRGAFPGRTTGQIDATVQPVTRSVAAFAMPLSNAHPALPTLAARLGTMEESRAAGCVLRGDAGVEVMWVKRSVQPAYISVLTACFVTARKPSVGIFRGFWTDPA